MLLRFRVSNFLSFDSPITIDLTAAKESLHSYRVATDGRYGFKVLQTAAVFGGNAVGKSNLCKALRFARSLIISGTKADGTINRAPFKLCSTSVARPTEFEFQFMTGELGEEIIYRYLLTLSSQQILSEALFEVRPSSEKQLFSRVARGIEHEFSLDWVERRDVSDEDRQFARFVAKGTRRNQPFLTEAVDRNLKFFKSIIAWFRDQLVILEPDAEYLSIETLDENRQELRDYVAQMLNHADTGIISVEAEPRTI